MIIKELAKSLVGLTDQDEILRRLLSFHEEFLAGYSCAEDESRLEVREESMRGGYFWLPCPLCGKWFGGQEMQRLRYVGIRLRPHTYTGVCGSDECATEARRLNKVFPSGILLETT